MAGARLSRCRFAGEADLPDGAQLVPHVAAQALHAGRCDAGAAALLHIRRSVLLRLRLLLLLLLLLLLSLLIRILMLLLLMLYF